MIQIFALLSVIPFYTCIQSVVGKKTHNLLELILLLSLYLAGVWFLYHGLALPDYGESTSPGTLPVILATLLCLLTLMQSLAVSRGQADNLSSNRTTPIPFIMLTGATAVYLLLVPLTGYYPATTGYLLTVLFLARERLMLSVFITVFWLIAVFLLFERALGISMPEGLWTS